MEFCKYHPIITAAYKCNHCHTVNCENCVNESNTGLNVCFLCQNDMQSLDVSHNITPFWRRLQESFHYPLTLDPLLMIGSLSLLMAIVSFSPFSIVFDLLLTSALFKYSFSSLESTAKGYMKAPNVNEAYGAGFGLIFQLILIVILLSAVVATVYSYIGPMIGTLLAVVVIIGMPAIVINFAITNNLIQALNPINIFKLITAIGLPYGLLLAFILIMLASVSIISQFIGHEFSLISLMLQAAVSNYYTIVLFHIMGYMIYQYQSELDFDTSYNYQEMKTSKSVLEKTMANIDVLIKEGEYEMAIDLYTEAIDTYPDHVQLKHNYFELLLETKNIELMDEFASSYIKFLIDSKYSDKVSLTYKRILKVYPKFKPNSAELRMQMAKICVNKGDSKSVVKLLNGIQKSFPKFQGLIEAFELMADALDSLPNMQNQAAACRAFITKLKL